MVSPWSPQVQPGAPVSANWMDQSLSRRFHDRVDGFDILENSSLMDNDFLGYAAHLKCQRTIALLQQAAYKDGRYHHGRQPTLSARDDLLCCSWTDLMMWAVLVDQVSATDCHRSAIGVPSECHQRAIRVPSEFD